MRFIVALLSSLIISPSMAEEVLGIPVIVDADTVYSGNTKIRLSGIDSPETDQLCLNGNGQSWTCGLDAISHLKAFSAGRPWKCQLTGLDRYERHLGSCSVGGEDVGQWLVRNGWALAFRRYSDRYIDDEDAARDKSNGLWAGAFVAPWDWRHRTSGTVILGARTVPTDARHKLMTSTVGTSPPSPECVVKGNMKKGGQCLYHVPGGQHYERLNMQPASNRRWFCSEQEALAAGCRKSKL